MKDLKQGNVRMVKATKVDTVVTGLENQTFDTETCGITGQQLEVKRTIYYLSNLNGIPLWNEEIQKNYFLIEHLSYTKEQQEMMWQADHEARMDEARINNL